MTQSDSPERSNEHATVFYINNANKTEVLEIPGKAATNLACDVLAQVLASEQLDHAQNTWNHEIYAYSRRHTPCQVSNTRMEVLP